MERKNLKIEESNELARRELRHVRWQEKSNALLTNSIGILFTLNATLTIFLLKGEPNVNLNVEVFEDWHLSNLCSLLLGIAALLGLCALLTRIIDFKLTARITRLKVIVYKKEKNLSGIENYNFDLKTRINCLRLITKTMGIATQSLFWLEAALFGSVVILLIIYL